MYSNNIQRIQGRYVGFLQVFTTYGVDEFPLKDEEIRDVLHSITTNAIRGKYLTPDDSIAGIYRILCNLGDLDKLSDRFHPLIWAYKRSEITTSCVVILYNEVLHEKLSKSN